MNKPRSRLLAYLIGVSARNAGSVCGDSSLQLFRYIAIYFTSPCLGGLSKSIQSNFFVLFSIMIAVSSHGVFASEGYFWKRNFNDINEPKYLDPVSACNYYLDQFEIPDKKNATTMIVFDRVGSYVYSARGNFYYYRCGGTLIRSWVPNAPVFNDAWVALTRYGDFCADGSNPNPTTGACIEDDQKGAPASLSCAGNPINIAIGNKYQAEIDYSVSNNSNLNFMRSYNSLDGLWRHNHSTYLRFAGTRYLSLVMADGRESFFTVSGTTVTASPTELGKLVKLADGWQYTAKSNERFTFDAVGRLTRWVNATGLEQQLSYSGTTITVTDTLGHSLSFTEDANHQPLSLTVNGLQISYSYNVNKRLTQLTRTQAEQTEQRSFHYEDSRNANWLTGITDERGVRYATWAYDDQGRATSSEHAGGIEHTDVVYNTDGSSTVTNELGKKTTYHFQAIDGIKRVSAIEGEPSANCPMSNSTFTYDSRGLLKTKTDNKGNLTTYDYNTRGLEVSRTEAAGTPQARTITTDWHPTLLLPVTVTEPTRITTYTYDAQGRQLSQSVTQR